MHTIHTTRNRLASQNLCEGRESDEAVILTRRISEGITAYAIESQKDGSWVDEGTVHLTADQIYEETSNGILSSLMGEEELAKRLGMDKRVLNVLLSRGKMVKPVKRLACGPLFLASDVDAWIAKNGKPKA